MAKPIKDGYAESAATDLANENHYKKAKNGK